MSANGVDSANLLVELFVEELPPKALRKLGEVFASVLTDSLKAQGLAPADVCVTGYASPRRLAVHLTGVLKRAADKPVAHKLMPVAVGLDATGNATPALLKRLAAVGANATAIPQLRRAMDGKNEALFLDSVTTGTLLVEGLQAALEAAMAKLPIPKMMSYQLEDGWKTVNFVRPVHGLVALHGTDIVPVSVLGLSAGRETQGHRFEASVSPVVVREADSYARQLETEGAVIASFESRRAEIVRQMHAVAGPLGLRPVEDDALLDEVTALVERPNVLLGNFEKTFLEVPPECLILTMKANQKYFPLLPAIGKLTNQFLIVSNISPADSSVVIGGNERVVRPRLADAKFFFDQDRKKTLASRVPDLDKVVYHNKLGTQGERVMRVQAIARVIGEKLGGEELALKADQAALLAKADLLTDMVGEFPELQGIMGRYYAQHDGYTVDIAFAIEDHYKPRFAGDELPRSDVGVCVALADKLETLVGMFGINNMPTGEKDPFALRRHALGVARLIVDRELALTVHDLIQIAYQTFKVKSLAPLSEIQPFLEIFCQERLVRYLESEGYEQRFIAAALSVQGMPHWAAIRERLIAVRAFVALPESDSLAAANKRVGNILKKGGWEVGRAADPAHFVEAAESELFAALGTIRPQAGAAFEAGDYTGSLTVLAALKAPVDAFFDQVMVNADDPALKANRLALLHQLHQTMNRVADISRLAA